MLDVLDRECSCWGMTINGEKTKVLTVGDHPEAADQTPITLQNHTLEDVTTFSYLGSQVEQTGKVEKEVATRIKKAGTVYQIWRRKVFRSYSFSRHASIQDFI